ncbi:MAG: pseudouridine synthase [Bacteroidales bacterium]|nr:pseudouridine synthase [Candidatus Cryptobacteroides equifaecalis]
MEQFTKEGRKLRPRKAAGTGSRSERVEYHSGEGRSFGERRSSGEHRSFGEGRPQRRSFGEGRPSSGEGRSFGERRSFGEHKSYGEHRSFGEGRPQRRSFGEGRPASGEGRSFGERKSYGEHRSFGEGRPQRRSFGEGRPSSGEGRSFGERRSFGEHKSYGEHRSFGEGRPQRRSFGDGKPGFKKSFGPKKSFNRPAPAFNRNTDEGISRMISRRPIVDEANYSDNDMAPTMIRDEVRLNKFIANSGVCSRREADTLIQAGVVTVNGEVVTELGTKVNIYTDDIRFNGERLKGEEKVYIVMNKPAGYVTTASDPHAEKTVIDLVKGVSTRVYPVGRLDKNTTGVLMLTNDGEMAERLTHPSYDKKKIYQVALDRALSEEDFNSILSGITLADGEVKADELEYIDQNDHRKLGIEIHSGKNRIVRRIFESLGYSVKALDRVYFAGLTKKGLKKGEWRYLSEGEANILKMGAYV